MLFRILFIFLVLAREAVLGKWTQKNSISDQNNFLVDSKNSIEFDALREYREKTSLRKEDQRHFPSLSNIPPAEDGAKVARYIVRNSNWGSLASASSVAGIEGFPFADVYSISDGPLGNTTGVPYFYVTPLDLTAQNLEKDQRCSLSLSLAEGYYCVDNKFDPEDPRCAHVVLTGKFVKVKAGTNDELFARNAMFNRHPVMKTWPKDHHWFFAKLEIKKICLLDYFGGVKMVSVDDYLHVDP